MQSHFDLMQFRTEVIDFAAQTPAIEPVAITPVHPIHLTGNPFDFAAQTPIPAITAQLPADVREHPIEAIDAPIQPASSLET